MVDLPNCTILRCPVCHLYVLERPVEPPGGGGYDRTRFESALLAVRNWNYSRIFDLLGEIRRLSVAKLLDVGCSSGWFLAASVGAGCDAYGIEPDEFFFRQARATLPPNVKLQCGSFPENLPPQWGKFDIISFNDVFEHLPAPLAVLHSVKDRLAPGGLLVLSVPLSTGFVFRLSRLLAALGIRGPLERLFQVHYPYPHLFYYSQSSLAALARKAGFEIVKSDALRSFAVSGSFHRARMQRTTSFVQSMSQVIQACGLVLFALIEPWLSADNGVFFLRPIPNAN